MTTLATIGRDAAMRASTAPAASAGPARLAEVADAEWDAFVSRHPDASAYHYAGWARLIARACALDARLLAVRTGERVTGVLPLVRMRTLVGRFVVSLPFLNAGGVL